MSFGFSVGDCLAVGKLIADITTCLKDVGGSKSEYRDVVIELECLQKALLHLDRLKPQGNSLNVDSIKYAALSCRRPLEEFLAKLKGYESTLGPRVIGSSWKAPIDKVRFIVGQKHEIRKMQCYLKTMNTAQENAQARQSDINKRLETTKGVLTQVRDSVTKQATAVFKATTLLERLYNLVRGEVSTSWKNLEGVVAAVCVSTQQIYGVVLEIRGAILNRPDIRWTFLQDPVLVEDALGRKFPVSSEDDFALLDRIIQHKFETGPGSTQVSHGDYQIRNGKDKELVLTSQSRLRPGSSLIMAILIGKPQPGVLTNHACPMPRCKSVKTTQTEGGGRLCCSCGVWFAETEQRRQSLLDLWEASILATEPANSAPMGASGFKRTIEDDILQGPSKRQKFTHDGRAEFKYISLADSDSGTDADTSSARKGPSSNSWTRGQAEKATEMSIKYLESVKDILLPNFDPEGSLSDMINLVLDGQRTYIDLETLVVNLSAEIKDQALLRQLNTIYVCVVYLLKVRSDTEEDERMQRYFKGRRPGG